MAFPLSSMNGDVHWNGSQVDHARGWQINHANQTKEYNSNKTKGKVSERPGPIKFSGSFTMYVSDDELPFLPGQIAPLKLYSEATKFWNVVNAIIKDINPNVNMETGELEGLTVNWAYAGADDSTNGQIVAPDGTVIGIDGLGELS